jgi:uncharacterized protein (TIGR01777 family)
MVIALSGYRGFVGLHIRRAFAEHEFILLKRDELYGDLSSLSRRIEPADIVINCAGYPVAKRWSEKNKKKIYRSRVKVTENLVKAINMLHEPPASFINTSAIGIYENGKEHNESDFTYNNDFLANVVKEWENSADQVRKDVKLVKIRLGLVLGRDGGALPRLLRLFNVGLGGVIGSGKQVYSFIHIDDVTGAIKFLISRKAAGVYNFTAPYPVTNKVFTKTLASKLKRPSLFTVPEFALRIAMGKAAGIVTRGQTVFPKKLLDEGYSFTFATIDQAIGNIVSK